MYSAFFIVEINVFSQHLLSSLYVKISTNRMVSFVSFAFVSVSHAGVIVTIVKLQELCTVHNKADSLLSSIIKL